MKYLFGVLLCLSFVNCTSYAGTEIKNDNPGLKPVLLVVDIQKVYLPQMDAAEREVAMRVINGLIWSFRQHGYPVIRIYHHDTRWGPEPGSEEFAYPESVIIQEEDPMIIKENPSAFTNTALDSLLKENECNTVFICGLSSVMCVLATYYGSVDKGYKTFLVRDAIMSHSREYTNVIKDICESVSFETVLYLLEEFYDKESSKTIRK